jgi:hypothetical protein
VTGWRWKTIGGFESGSQGINLPDRLESSKHSIKYG